MRHLSKASSASHKTPNHGDNHDDGDFVVIDPDVLIMSEAEVTERLKSFFRKREQMYPLVK